jgi:2'-5' RNA ligase
MAQLAIRHRYFFCLRPCTQDANRIHAFADSLRGPWKLQSASRLHVTAAITEDWPVPVPALVAALLRAGDAVQAQPFELVLDQLSASPTHLVLRPARAIPELKELGATIRAAMAQEGVPLREGWRFNPHMTLGFGRGRQFVRPVQPVSWSVNEFILVHSAVGATNHEVLGRWTLEPQQEAQLSLFAA